MALTAFQLELCRLIARQRVESGESYVAGGTALNSAIGAARISRHIDLFHDTVEAVDQSFAADRKLLAARGCEISIQRERTGFVEALVIRGHDRVVLQWAADSAFRFFPLVEHPDFGLVLHPFDLATNKVLALVGRVEARDWVDIIGCHERVQRLGYLAWAASGKDPGFGPSTILEQAARSARYSAAEIAGLDFEGPAPDAAELSTRWHSMLDEARSIVDVLPAPDVGKCVLEERGELFAGDPERLRTAMAAGAVRFHEGRIRGALPHVRGGN
jgi:hypothetical protein